jgi:hypothetical protein
VNGRLAIVDLRAHRRPALRPRADAQERARRAAPKPSAIEPSAMPALEPARARKLRRAGIDARDVARRTSQTERPATTTSDASAQTGPAMA